MGVVGGGYDGVVDGGYKGIKVRRGGLVVEQRWHRQPA